MRAIGQPIEPRITEYGKFFEERPPGYVFEFVEQAA